MHDSNPPKPRLMSPLDLTVRLCRALSAVKVDDSVLSGHTVELTPDLLDVLKRLERESHYMLPFGFDEESAVGKPFDVKEVSLPRLHKYFFAQTWQDLLAHHDFRFSAPGDFYVLESDYYSKLDAGDTLSRQYSDVISLIRFLEGVADVSQGHADQLTLFFLLNEKLDLSVEYDATDLCVLDGLDAFCDQFSASGEHCEQRKSIVKVVLLELLKSIPREQRFRHLLKIFDEFVKRSNDNLQLYVTNFSFERVKEQVEKNRLEYTLKLNKVFSEIQNQLLAVPAALLLIGTQLDAKSESLPKNCLVIVGIFVFAWFMNMLLKNQCHSLTAIKAEISELKHELGLKDSALVDKLMPEYTKLDDRYDQQKNAMLLVDGAVALVLGTCVLLFGRYVLLW